MHLKGVSDFPVIMSHLNSLPEVLSNASAPHWSGLVACELNI